MPEALAPTRADKAKKTVQVTHKLAQPSIGEMVDQLADLREKKRELEDKVKAVESEFGVIEAALMEKLDTEKTDAARGKLASCSITETVVATVKDWDAFFKYVKKTGYFHLFQRRVTDTAYRELLEQGKKVPGVEPFTKRRLNLRSL